MINPILEGLQNGEKYPFRMLCHERDAINDFWNWWWEHKFNGSLMRPYTIIDGDPILTETDGKKFVDTISDDVFFPNPLTKALESGILPVGHAIDRTEYRERVADHLMRFCPTTEVPIVVFTGGGYGSGKTVTMQFLIKHQHLECGFGLDALVGVDYCKQLLPEFNLLRSVADGRASALTQKESRIISDLLFGQLISEKRSFGWDSSMSNLTPTLKKINYAKDNGYQIILIGIFTRLDVAKERAMNRAFETKRFPPPQYLESSHKQFIENVPHYIPLFDNVYIIENSEENGNESAQQILARKMSSTHSLEILDDQLFRSYVSNSV